jgi:hypothetical protein
MAFDEPLNKAGKSQLYLCARGERHSEAGYLESVIFLDEKI